MTIKEAKIILPIIKAYSEGKTIQVYSPIKREWEDIEDPAFNCSPGGYRIKPEPVYHPYTSPQLREAIKTHGREVRSKSDPETILLIVGQSEHSAYIANIGRVGYSVFLNDWVWNDDNSPCGTTNPLPF